MLVNVLSIIIAAILLSQIIGWEMVATIGFFAGVMLAMKLVVLSMIPVPIGIIMGFGIFSFIGFLFVARHLAQIRADKKYRRDPYFHKVRAEMARTVC
ncbi:MAG: hypothetical protein WC774_01580 [Candidatus Gracilibacteria bacterium]|jgi:hypothetical protein